MCNLNPLSRQYPLAVVTVLLGLAACAPEEPAEIAAEAAPTAAAQALLARSIEVHDPAGMWTSATVSLAWNGTGSEGEERVALDLTLYPDGSTFAMSGRYRGREIAYAASGDEVSIAVDGSDRIPAETAEELRLRREDGFFWRSYFGFLTGLPMKLRDPGTRIDPEPLETEFMGRPVSAIRVTYDAEVGGDTWYFYFAPETAELVGCRFYHDESVNDGEYIVFEGLVESGGMRLPARRSWYVNADDRFLGSDELSGLTVSR
jgi:hypothetical protein